MRTIDNITTGTSQITILPQALQYVATDSLSVPTFTTTSTYDNCSRTAVSLDNTTGAIATRTEIIDKTLQSRQVQTLQNTTTLATINSNCEIIAGTPQSYLQLISDEITVQAGAVGMSSQTTQAQIGCNHTDFPSGRVQQASITTNNGSSTLLLQTVGASSTVGNITLAPGFAGTDGTLNFTASGSSANFAITTNRNIAFNSLNVSSTPTNFRLLNSAAGGATNPLLTLQNTNATGSVAMEVYKDKPTAGANGDVLFTQSVFGKDSGNVKQEYTRITSTIRDATAGAEDGSMELGCFVNGAFTNFIQLNANDTPIGEVNFTRPLDFIGGSDANATIKVSGTGSVNLNLDATVSAGAGAIALKTKDGTAGSGAGLVLNGNTLLSGSAGGHGGQHLALTINGTVYKIALLNA
jgi:hypothetical protein